MIRSINIRVKAKRLYNSYDIHINSIIDRYFSLGNVSKCIDTLSNNTGLIAWNKELQAYSRNLHILKTEIVQTLIRKCLYKDSYNSSNRIGYTRKYPFLLNITTHLDEKGLNQLKERTVLVLTNGQELKLTDYINMYDMIKTTGEEKEEINSLIENKAVNEDMIDKLDFALTFEEYRGIRPKLLFYRENRTTYGVVLIFSISNKNDEQMEKIK